MASITQYDPLGRFDRMVTPAIRAGNTFVVTLYKAAGFVTLFVILAALASYLFIHIFFFLSSSWLTPVMLSTSDDHVLRVQSEISGQELIRDRLLGDRIELSSKIRGLEQHSTAERSLQQGIRQTITGGQADRTAEATTLQKAAEAMRSISPTVTDVNTDYAKQLQSSTDQLAGVHLITQQEIAERKYQVSQLAIENASLAQRDADLKNRLRALQRESESLRAVRSKDSSDPSALTFDVMKVKAQMDNAGLFEKQDAETARQLLNRVTLEDGTLRRIDALLTTLYASPYLRAALQGQVLAFVPYRNLHNVAPARPIFTCRLTLVWCERVGEVVAGIPGEVLAKDPITGKDERGIYFQITLLNKKAAEQQILYVGRKPLWF
jgi:hypothetical protein